MNAANRHILAVSALAEAGEIQWQAMTVPKPGAMRAFEGRAGIYSVMVTQANIINVGVRCHGMLVARGFTPPIVLPDKLAAHLYHLAAAGFN